MSDLFWSSIVEPLVAGNYVDQKLHFHNKRYVIINEESYVSLWAEDLLPKEHEKRVDWLYRAAKKRVKKIFASNDLNDRYDFKESDLHNAFRLINVIHDAVKLLHRNQTRESGERYFEHIFNVVVIALFELWWESLEEIITAYFHDTDEDTVTKIDDFVSFFLGRENERKHGEANILDVLENVAWNVKTLTKKDKREYLTPQDIEELSPYFFPNISLLTSFSHSTISDFERQLAQVPKEVLNKMGYFDAEEFIQHLKDKRNLDYFTHAQHYNYVLLLIKVADRIHNLRTEPLRNIKDVKKIKRKIEETENYFYPALQKPQHAKLLAALAREVEKLKKKVNTSEFVKADTTLMLAEQFVLGL